MKALAAVTLAFAVTLSFSIAQTTCSTSLIPTNSVKPSIASGYNLQLVATGLATPRGIKFDTAGNLLVVETAQSNGSISALTLQENGACVSVSKTTTVISGQGLNHGIELSADGTTLYASNSESVWAWNYNSTSQSSSNQRLLVTNMTTSDHTTRTLLLSQKAPGMLLVSRGSTSNIDIEAADLNSGHSQIRAFNITGATQAYEYDTAGVRLGWGLRNSVGVAEHPVTGGIYSVENSADQITRMGIDVHQDNPGEEMNFHGYLNGTVYGPQGQNYGYPWCFAAWGLSELPDSSNLTVGSQFAIDASSDSNNMNKTDAYCAAQNAPRLTFQAHMAPLDIKFNNSGTEGWVTYHGSWDRTQPVGYKVSLIRFTNGDPVDPANSTTATTDVFANSNNAVCPDNCFRPVSMAFDSKGRLFVSSDATGEIYMITRDQSTNGTASTSSSSTTSGSAASSTSSSGAEKILTASAATSLLGASLVSIWSVIF